MKKNISILITTAFLCILQSCSKRNPEFIEQDFSGDWKIIGFTVNPDQDNHCSSSNSTDNFTFDLRVNSDNTFEQKVYTRESDGNCVFTETLKGKIITIGTAGFATNAKLEYVNPDANSSLGNKKWSVYISNAKDGRYNSIVFNNDSPQPSGVGGGQIFFDRIQF